jgi:hypothetical protein
LQGEETGSLVQGEPVFVEVNVGAEQGKDLF